MGAHCHRGKSARKAKSSLDAVALESLTSFINTDSEGEKLVEIKKFIGAKGEFMSITFTGIGILLEENCFPTQAINEQFSLGERALLFMYIVNYGKIRTYIYFSNI